MDYKYSELQYAQKIYEEGFQSEKHRPTEMRLVATYMRRILNLKPKQLREEMYKWAENHIPGYRKELYYKVINRAISQGCKKGSSLVDVDRIDFYQYELDYLDNLEIFCSPIEKKQTSDFSHECKKFLFSLLFKMKANKYITEAKNSSHDFEYKGKYFKGGQKKYNELKKIAKIPDAIQIHEDIINTLWVNSLVTPLYNGLIKLDFMEHIYAIQEEIKEEPSAIIQITDFDSIGWYFDYYKKNPKIAFCKKCGKIFKKKNNRQLYCSEECSKNVDKEKAKQRMKQLYHNENSSI